jgi:hypothetical protein
MTAPGTLKARTTRSLLFALSTTEGTRDTVFVVPPFSWKLTPQAHDAIAHSPADIVK